ncbi:ABC transporter permease [Ktedonosporobacter rubrisoli]|uniref:ABC transporter permease n=1 Tax=Ktedonosporobacter rubrisoli TaxID=2509675 RepID=A0A4P6JM96_KTERU|nr:ABC transporter permease [Ktedonosporobacter rubrisoli]QBD76369.1 ABC transporter permease [Ktedonosporobacter rubrisoli]
MKDTAREAHDAEGRQSSAERGIVRRTMGVRLADAAAQLAAAGALIIVSLCLSLVSPVFLTFNNLFNIVAQTAVTAVIAIGMTFVIITAGIDLSVGSTAALGGMLGTLMMSHTGLSWPLAVVGGALIGGVIGLGNGLLITGAGLNPFIATLGMMSVARGLTYLTTNAVGVYGLPGDFGLLGQGLIDNIPIPLVILVIVAILAHLLLTRTRLGRYTYAIGSNQEAARLSGIPIGRYLIAIYVLQGLLAGFAGMIASSRVVSGQPNFGVGLELDVIAATVIGGASLFGGQGTIIGTLIGAFLIAVIRNGCVLLNINLYYQDVISGAVIWLAVYWDQFRRKKLATASQ